ncbi:GSCOCG00010030001-RA-CDS [Cotesia congregata]|uniref:protein-serine/threonine phosphatase n=1 Tax=Cotesia congregata TaxID=51543 RepID=A0A8J2HAK7_COTCN|nr:GSCOCG00010030001-RA-CDS [Cotesia congregata]CAG5090899.1 Similar to ssh: Protein phosphatase Slingshot (Drosophila melanogaster) [Cotesia congregata]
MWSALQTLHKVSSKAREQNYFLGGLSHDWVSYYEQRIESDRSCLNEWHAMDNLESRRPPSPDSVRHKPREREETEGVIRATLKEIMMSVDLDEVTSKYIRGRLEEDLDMDLGEFKPFIDQEMLTILGQMDAPTEIFDHVYLGSEWNASNLEELQKNGVKHILNVTREIDNFFPGMFNYLNVRVYDDEKTDLLKHWDDTFKYITKARKEGSKVLVHCKMGVSRSASVVIAYAMKAYNWDFSQAWKHVKDKRNCIKPNNNFLLQLETYQGILDAMKNKEKLQRSKSDTNLKSPTTGGAARPGRTKPESDKNSVPSQSSGTELKKSGKRPKSWSPYVEMVDNVLPALSQSLESIDKTGTEITREELLRNVQTTKLVPEHESRNVLMPCDNGQSYSVSQNQIVHLPGPDNNNTPGNKLESQGHRRRGLVLNLTNQFESGSKPSSPESDLKASPENEDTQKMDTDCLVWTEPKPGTDKNSESVQVPSINVTSATCVNLGTITATGTATCSTGIIGAATCSNGTAGTGTCSSGTVGTANYISGNTGTATYMSGTAICGSGTATCSIGTAGTGKCSTGTATYVSGTAVTATCNTGTTGTGTYSGGTVGTGTVGNSSAISGRRRTKKEGDLFSAQVDKVFDREERREPRELPSRQSSWSSYDSAVVLDNSVHSSWATLPSRNSSWGSYDMRSNPDPLGSSGLFPYDREEIPWHPGTVKRTKQKIEEGTGTKRVCTQNDDKVESTEPFQEPKETVDSPVGGIDISSTGITRQIGRLSTSAPAPSALEPELPTVALRTCRSESETSSPCVVNTPQCPSVKHHKMILENLTKPNFGKRCLSVDDSPEPPCSSSSSSSSSSSEGSRNKAGIVKNLKKEFEAKSKFEKSPEGSGDNVTDWASVKRDKIRSLPSSPVIAHNETKIRTSASVSATSIKDDDLEDLSVKVLVGKYEVKPPGSKDEVKKSEVQLRAHNLEAHPPAKAKIAPQEFARRSAPIIINSAVFLPEASAGEAPGRPPIVPSPQAVVASVVKAAKKQQQHGRTHPLTRLQVRPRHSSPVYNTM